MGKYRNENEGDNAVGFSLFREKRKWQIALRRYVLERNPSVVYAPYFGLDIENMRRWFETQFTEGVSWESFGVNWQFDHIIPVSWFDFTSQDDLRLCWNFVNLRVSHFRDNAEKGHKTDLSVARAYFMELYDASGHSLCINMLKKVEQIEKGSLLNTFPQKQFLSDKRQHLIQIADFGREEFELLNRGRTLEEVRQEIEIARRFGG